MEKLAIYEAEGGIKSLGSMWCFNVVKTMAE